MLSEFIELNRDDPPPMPRQGRDEVVSSAEPRGDRSRRPSVSGSTGRRVAAGRGGKQGLSSTALLHGQDLLLRGFTVSQVMHDYGDVCQSITELAVVELPPCPVPVPANS